MWNILKRDKKLQINKQTKHAYIFLASLRQRWVLIKDELPCCTFVAKGLMQFWSKMGLRSYGTPCNIYYDKRILKYEYKNAIIKTHKREKSNTRTRFEPATPSMLDHPLTDCSTRKVINFSTNKTFYYKVILLLISKGSTSHNGAVSFLLNYYAFRYWFQRSQIGYTDTLQKAFDSRKGVFVNEIAKSELEELDQVPRWLTI